MSKRLNVQKTYKLYIGGKFPRTESGRYFKLTNSKGDFVADVCRGSRKDFREAVKAARKAQCGWWGKTAYNRGQIIYRIAEMMEGRRQQFIDELTATGSTKKQAERELAATIDRIVYYAGWADKYQQIISAVNPVATPHFNFSVPEPTGVVGIIAPETPSLLGLISVVIPVITGGNTCVALASETSPLVAVTFGEVLHSSDVPGGVINMLTGYRNELLSHFASHMDVNAVAYCGGDPEEYINLSKEAAVNVKRVMKYDPKDWFSPKEENIYKISDFTEIKTTWHPVGI